jgi:SAM-dependent methyltransferase
MSGEAAVPRHPDFSRRSDEAEWLDRPDLDGAALAPVLRDLARFNRAMLGHWPILRWLGRATAASSPGESLRLIDAGCGYGDLLRAIRRWAERRRLPLALCGLDVNPETIRIARAATEAQDRIEFAVADVLRYRPAAPVDLILCSLLAHHLSDEAIVDLLRWMDGTARRGWLVCDLERHPVPYHVIGLAGRLTPLHPTVIHDGQISVARALTRQEWIGRLAAAGIPGGRVTMRRFWFRHLIGCLR